MNSQNNPSEFIINVAFTGAVSDKNKNPAVPSSLDEIVADSIACAKLGASIGHYHVRNELNEAVNDPQRYAALFSALRNNQDTKETIIVASTSGRHGQSLNDRAAVLHLPPAQRPDMASLTLSSLNFATGASINQPDDIRFLAATMLEMGVKPELEIFDLGMVTFAKQLIQEGLLKPPFYFNAIFENVAGAQADLLSAGAILSALPENSIVCFGGIGRGQVKSHLLAMNQADGVRTGLEDNFRLPKTRELTTNVELVRNIIEIGALAGRQPISNGSLRTRLGLCQSRS